MPVFAYKGLDASGKSVTGVQDSESSRALMSAMKSKGVFLTDVKEQHGVGSAAEAAANSTSSFLSRDVKLFERRVGISDIALLTQQMATLIRAGLPLADSLSALIEQTEHPRLRLILVNVRDDVNEGTSLADALGKHSSFSELYVNMVRAGEASGTLDVVLDRLAEFTERQKELKSKVTGALAYPAIIVVIGILMMSILMIVVVPQITAIFADMDAALPWYTRLLIGVSDFMASYWWLLAILVGLGSWGFRYWKNTPAGRQAWDSFTLKAPLFGNLLRQVALARFSRTLSTLLRSAVPILEALEIVKQVLGNVVLQKAVEDAQVAVREGESLAKPLKRSGEFPPMVVHMIAIGEKSGQLEEMLGHVATAYESRVNTTVNTVMRAMEPLIIVVMAVGVGFIVFSILMPLLNIHEFAQ